MLVIPLAAYCVFGGINALQTGHSYMALKYLEGRIASQAVAAASFLGGSVYWKYKDRNDLMAKQPYGPYRYGYGKVHEPKE